jgi:hypothetical protein
MDELSKARSQAMDELEAVRRLLTQPPPGPEVVEAARANLGRAGSALQHEGHIVHLNGTRHMFGRQPSARRHRWRNWLAPVAAAVAVVAVLAGSLAISGAIGRHHGAAKTSGNPAAAVAAAGVPRYFVALPGSIQGSGAPRAVVGATATGAVLGTVTAPTPYSVFTWAAASGNDRVFVLAAQRPMKRPGPSQSRFYRLVLSRSGRPGPLELLRVPPQTGDINGFAMSPNGKKLAMSLLPGTTKKQPGGIEVFSLTNGDLFGWTWPGSLIGWTKPFARSLSWEADNRTLLYQVNIASSHAGAFLLDTASPNSAPRRIPIPSQELSATIEKGQHVSGPMLITGDGTKVVAPTTTLISPGTGLVTRRTSMYLDLHRQCGASIVGFTKQNGRYIGVHYINYRKTLACLKLIQQRDRYFRRNIAPRADHLTPETSDITITEISVKTGKPVLVLDRQVTQDQGWMDVQWAGTTGTSLIVDVPGAPAGAEHIAQPVLGVQDGATFTPLPQRLQRAFATQQIAW